MALARLRKLSKSPIVVVILGLIALSFVLVIGNGGTSVRSLGVRAVASVGGEEVSVQQFGSEYDRQIKQISEQLGQPITPEMGKQMGLVQQVLGSLINRAALKKHASSLGVVGSDKAVKRELYKIQAFQGPNQKFDPNQYKLLLNANNLNQSEFEANIRTDIVIEQMFELVESGITPPKGLAELIFRFQAESRGADYIILSPDLVGAIEDPGDDALKEFYESNKAIFTIPEMRKISYLDIKPEDFMATVTVSEEDIAALYERTEQNYITPETRTIKEIYGTEDVVKEAASRIKAGESFDAVATGLGFTAEEYDRGAVLPHEISDKAVADAVFAKTEPGLLEPVQGGLSWSLVELQSIQPEVVQTLDDVRDELRASLAERDAQDMVFSTIEIIEEEVASGTPLEEIGRKTNIPVSVIENVSSTGTGPDGAPVAAVPDDPKFLEEAFATVVGFASDVMEVGDNRFVTLEVDEITPSVTKPYDDVRAQVLTEWRQVQRANKLEDMAAGMVARGNAGEDFAALGGEVGRGVLTVSTPITRGDETDLISLGVNRQLFAAQTGEFVYGNLPEGEGLLVAKLTAIDIPNTAAAGNVIDSFQGQIGNQMSQDMERLYVQGLIARYGVKQNPAAIDQVLGLVDPTQ